MPTPIKTGVIWGDVNGFSRLLTINTATINPLTLLNAMHAASNGDWTGYWVNTFNAQAGTTFNATYNSVLDTAVLSFETAAGNIVTLRLPAPLLGDFKADQQTVDPAAPAVTFLIASCLAQLTDPGGNPVVTYLGGFYQRTGKAFTGGS